MKYLLSQVLVAVAASAMPYHGHGYLNNVAVFAAKEAANFAAMATPPILDAVPVAMAARQVADANPMDANAQTAADAAILSAIANPALPNLAAAEAAFAVDPTNAAFAARRNAETLTPAPTAATVLAAATTALTAAQTALTAAAGATPAVRAAAEQAVEQASAAVVAITAAGAATPDVLARHAEAAYNPAVTAARLAWSNGNDIDAKTGNLVGGTPGNARAVARAARVAADAALTNMAADRAASLAEFSQRTATGGADPGKKAFEAAQRAAASAAVTNPFG